MKKSILTVGAIIGLGVGAALLMAAMPQFSAFVNPPCRQDIALRLVADNSNSADGLKPEIMEEQMELASCPALGDRPINTKILRMASCPVEIYHGSNDERSIAAVYQEHYLHTRFDSTPGSYVGKILNPVLEEARQNPRCLYIVAVGADSYEDAAETKKVAAEIACHAPNILVIHHAVPVHDPIVNKQMTLREDSQRALKPLGDNAMVCGKLEFDSTLSEWLPRKLREKGYKP